jgi:hypothetical protein
MFRYLRGSRALRYLTATVAVALAVGCGLAIAASSGGVIHGCAAKVGGALRIAKHCKSSERSVSWNKQGLQGLRGLRGPQGVPGPSHGYSTGFTDLNPVTLSSAGETHTLMSLSVPSGDYIVIARLQGITGNDGGGNDFRYDCVLGGPAATIDAPIYRVGETDSVENYLTYEGGYSGAGPITLSCRSANVHTLTALSGSMVAIAVGGLN